jgi:hypothetical protein
MTGTALFGRDEAAGSVNRRSAHRQREGPMFRGPSAIATMRVTNLPADDDEAL